MLIWLLPLLVWLWIDELRPGHKSRYEEIERSATEPRFDSKRQGYDAVVFRLASRNGGKVTVSEVVAETGLDVRTAERFMDSLADGIHVDVDLDGRGRRVYVFPELASPPR